MNRGLIPAHAGKIAKALSAARTVGAHPRSRGENGDEVDGPVGESGSSPLTRGKLSVVSCFEVADGLIPAHAGKIRRGPPARGPARAHPRSRGENTVEAQGDLAPRGSSPLTRGKCKRRKRPRNPQRLIPAHAGKIGGRRLFRGRRRAHPRSRGENGTRPRPHPENDGSSPLTRGKYFLTCAFIAQIGQILESLELCASSETYSLKDVSAIDSLRDRVRSIGLDPLNSTGASSV